MSVINQMLKDLESQRKTPSTGTWPGELHSVTARRFVKINKKIFFFLLAIIISLLLLKGFMIHPAAQHHFLHLPPMMEHSHGKEKMPPPINVVLKNINLNNEDNKTQVIIQLPSEVYYTISLSTEQELIKLNLYHVNLPKNFNTVDSQNSLIKQLTVNTKNDITEVTLRLTANTQITNLHYERESKQLVLSLVNSDKSTSLTKVMLKKTFVPLTAQQQAMQQYEQALELIGQGDLIKSKKILSQLVGRHADYKAARQSLVTLLIHQGLDKEARPLIKKGLQFAPNYQPFIKLMVKLLIKQNKLQTALTLLTRAQPAIETDPDYYALMAALYQRLNKANMAAQIYQRLVTVASHNAKWWLGLAINMEQLQQTNRALEAYQRALVSQGLTPSLHAYIESRINVITGRSHVS